MRSPPLFVVAVLVAGCASGTPRAGAGEDAGSPPPHPPDAGAPPPASDRDAGVDAGAPAPDSGSAPVVPDEIDCGPAVCDGLAERCCIETVIHHECRPRDLSCPFEWATAMCDGPEDCYGSRCCIDLLDARGPRACRPSCLGPEVELCHTPSDCVERGPYCCYPVDRPAGFCVPDPLPEIPCDRAAG